MATSGKIRRSDDDDDDDDDSDSDDEQSKGEEPSSPQKDPDEKMSIEHDDDDDDDDDDDESSSGDNFNSDDGGEEEDKAMVETEAMIPVKPPMAVASVVSAPPLPPPPPLLSKSWSIHSSHVPTFTGGKITHCHTAAGLYWNNESSGTAPSAAGAAAAAKEQQQDHQASTTTTTTTSLPRPFLLLPVGGDVALVDAHRGVQITRVRGGGGDPAASSAAAAGNEVEDDFDYDDDDDDDDELDVDAISAYALSSNDQMIITCSRNSLMRQYAITTTSSHAAATTSPAGQHNVLTLVKTWGKSGHLLPVTFLEFHFSNVFVATGSVDGTVRVWDVRGAYVTHVFRPFQAGSGSGSGGGGTGGSARLSVTSLAWLPDARLLFLAIARDDGSIAIHNLLRQQPQQEDARKDDDVVILRDHVSSVTSMAWMLGGGGENDDKLFVTTGRDAVINLWKMTYSTTSSNNEKKKSKNKKGNNKSAASAAAELTTITYRRIQTLPIYEQVEGMVIVPTNPQQKELLVATAGSKGRVRLWSAPLGSSMDTATTARIALKLKAEQPLAESFGEARGGYMNLRFNPHAARRLHDDKKENVVLDQLIVADAEHNVSFLSLDQKRLLSNDRTIVGHNDDVLDIKLIPSASSVNNNHDKQQPQRIVVATNSAQVRLFDLETYSCQILDGHTATVLGVDVSPCGRFVATCGKDKQMRLWHVADNSRKCVAVAIGHAEAVGSTALSRKLGRYEVSGKAAHNGGGAFCITVSADRTMKRWNLPGAADLEAAAAVMSDKSSRTPDTAESSLISLKAFKSARAHEKDINIVTVAPNDSLIATGSQDKTVKLWKATDLSLHATLKGHRRGVWDCQFSPFDRILATASGDRTIKLWSLSDFSCVRTFQGHLSTVLRVRFLSGGLQLVSSGADGLIKLWTIRTTECDATMDGHSDKVWALDLSPDGKSLVSGGADSQIVVWNDTTVQEEQAKRAEEEEQILTDQKLANHLRHKEYKQALEITLERDKPHQALKVLIAIIETDVQKTGGTGLEPLQQHARGWTPERLARILSYCREWNTRALNSHVALLVVQAVVTCIPIHKLVVIDGVPEIMAGIMSYAERHFDRLDKLFTSSYLLDFALSNMGSLEADDDLNAQAEFATWESSSKLVLPPKQIDGRVQIGGTAVVGAARKKQPGGALDDDDDEVLTVGDSDSSVDSENDSDSSSGRVDGAGVVSDKGGDSGSE